MPPSIGDTAPAQFSDLAPGDTSGVITMMRQTMQQIDAGLTQMTRRDTALVAVADSQRRRLTAWLQNGMVRKLVVGDSGGSGPGPGDMDIWFVGGDVAVVQTAADVYALDAGRIVLWTDAGMDPRADLTQQLVMARETEIVDSARKWLAVFGIGLP